jgi:FkbM family methyltransferase
MDLYGQNAEVMLLGRLIPRLEQRSIIDVGAERGGFVEAMLRAGAESVHAFEPDPDNAAALNTLYGADDRVRVHACAVSDDDGTAELHLSRSPGGQPLTFGHTLLKRANTTEIEWNESRPVGRRSLESLLSTGELPPHAGILKIDTEGHDLRVVEGMGRLQADVVMVEHWSDLPNGLGRCPWSSEEIVAALAERGFAHFAFVVHRGHFVTQKWDDAEVELGAMGNLVFLHERVIQRLLPDVLAFSGFLAEEAVRLGQDFVAAAEARATVIDELKRTADDRLAVIEEISQAADDRARDVETLDRLAAERLARIRELEAELDALRAGTR